MVDRLEIVKYVPNTSIFSADDGCSKWDHGSSWGGAEEDGWVEEVALTTGATGVEVAASTGLGVDEDATTTGGDETTGVTIGATGDEETATGVALVAMTGCVKVQGQSVTVKVVACKGIRQSTRQIDRVAKMHSR